MILSCLTGCMTYKLMSDSESIIEIRDNEKRQFKSSPNSSSKVLMKFKSDVHEHLRFPILKLGQNEESAYPCKLTWTKSGNENWKVSKINDMKNHEK